MKTRVSVLGKEGAYLTPLIVLLAVVAMGLLIGRISIFGISFGSSSILFIALLAGHLGMNVPEGVGSLGLALFVYCIGISAGPTFFRGLASHGSTMASLGAMIVITGVVVAWVCAKLFELPADITGGLMAGAMTSTPALGAIAESVAEPANVAVGFGVAYPIGIVSVVLFVQLAMKLLQPPATSNKKQDPDATEGNPTPIVRRAIEIANPGIVGRRPSEVEAFSASPCQISRLKAEDRWRPLPPDYCFAIGDYLLLVGSEHDIQRVAETLGTLRNDDAIVDADRERKTLVVTSPSIYGHTLKELSLRSKFGVTVVRVRRHEMEFVPSGQTTIEFGDTLTLVGEPQSLAAIESVVGHRPRALNETDLFSLAAGILLGVLIGKAELEFGSFSVSLGIAGGPLFVGLVLGHFRHVGPIRGSFPPAAQLLMTEGGLALFLSDAGVKAGANVWEVLAQHGLVLCFVAGAIAIIPMLVGFVVAKYWFKLSLLQSLGSTCGGMTSTPGLAVLTSATDSSQPVTSYVAAYPVALVLITIMSPSLVSALKTLFTTP
jgi:putative transport protein